jgi:hypothetical protein
MPRRLLRFVSSRLNACTLAGHGLETDDNTAPAQINSNAPSQGLEAPRSLSLPWLHLLPPVPPQQCELVQLVISRRAQHRLTRVLGQASGTASLTGIAIRQDRAEEDAAITIMVSLAQRVGTGDKPVERHRLRHRQPAMHGLMYEQTVQVCKGCSLSPSQASA